MTRDPKGFLHGGPDLAIEVLSPSNAIQAMKKKALEYFESGSRLVWLVVPDDRIVMVLLPDSSELILTAKDILTGEDILSGFSVEVSKLFAGLE
jgi:Uma2 family endonuclease